MRQTFPQVLAASNRPNPSGRQTKSQCYWSFTVKTYTGRENFDHDLNPGYWLNTDTRQTHYFISFLATAYPGLHDPAPKLIVKPGKVCMFPHKYYRVHSRDGSPVHGNWLIGEMIEDAAPASLTKGDAFGHEE